MAVNPEKRHPIGVSTFKLTSDMRDAKPASPGDDFATDNQETSRARRPIHCPPTFEPLTCKCNRRNHQWPLSSISKPVSGS